MLRKYIITETVRTEIKAVSMEKAVRKWLDGNVWELMRKGHLTVRDRQIQSVDLPAMPPHTF